MTRWAWIATGSSLALAAVLAIALIIVVATDGDDSTAAGAPAAPSVQFGGQLPSDVQDCLSQRGIQAPEPGSAPDSSVDPDELRQALEDCGATAPGGTIPFGQEAPGSG
jgi:hypothetical protein